MEPEVGSRLMISKSNSAIAKVSLAARVVLLLTVYLGVLPIGIVNGEAHAPVEMTLRIRPYCEVVLNDDAHTTGMRSEGQVEAWGVGVSEI